MGENVFKLHKNDGQKHGEEGADAGVIAGADADATPEQARETVSHDPTRPEIVPRLVESTDPDAFKRFLGEHKAITDVMIHGSGGSLEVRTMAPNDKGGVSRFSIDAADRQRFEQIASDAGYGRMNQNTEGVILLHKK